MSDQESFRYELDRWLASRAESVGFPGGLHVEGNDPWSLTLKEPLGVLGLIRIQSAVSADHPALRRFLEALGERSHFLFAPYPMDDRLDETLAHVLDACAQKRMLVLHAWRDDEVVAHCFLDGLDRTQPELGIAVAEACQGHKLGHVLIALLQGCAIALDRRRIGLTTHTTNAGAFHLYQKSGFRHVADRLIGMADGSRRWEREMVCELPTSMIL